jgi:hypothetical protein
MTNPNEINQKFLEMNLENHFKDLKDRGLIVDYKRDANGYFLIQPVHPVDFINMTFTRQCVPEDSHE